MPSIFYVVYRDKGFKEVQWHYKIGAGGLLSQFKATQGLIFICV